MNPLIHPMYAIVMLTFFVAVRLLWVRAKAVSSGTIKLSYFRSLSAPPADEAMATAARHFVNLFEVPVLFFAACLTAMTISFSSQNLIIAAWFFVGCRVSHAIIHLTYNNVNHRFVSYLLGYLTILYMWTLLALG